MKWNDIDDEEREARNKEYLEDFEDEDEVSSWIPTPP